MIENIEKINRKFDQYLSIKFNDLKESNILLQDICEIKYGKSLEASKLQHDLKYSVYGGNGIIGTSDSYMFEDSKIAISCRGAASGNVILTEPYSSISSNSLYLNLYDSNMTLALYSYLKQIQLSNYATGSAQPQITIDNLKLLKVPDFSSMKYNGQFVIDIINSNNCKLKKLHQIKQLLLSKYF